MSTGVARACPLPPGASASLAEVSPEARLEYLRESLLSEGQRVHTWSTLWIGGTIILIAGAAGVMPFYSPGSRVGLYVGIGATVLGALPLQLIPPSVQRDGPLFQEHIDAFPPSGDICRLIAEGERFMIRDARQEGLILGPINTLINAAYNIGVLLVLGFGFHQWASGGAAMLSGFAFGEVVMYTQPRALPSWLDEYLAGHPKLSQPAATWRIVPQAAGLALNVAF
jgi:hypothetical protein